MAGTSWGDKVSTSAAVALLLGALLGCKHADSDKATPAASVSAPSTTASAKTEVTEVKISEHVVASGWTKDSQRFVQTFKFALPDSARAGASFKDARAACEAVGRDLCSEDQWELACGVDDTVGKVASWTITPAGASGWRTRGGGGCDTRADSSDGSATSGRMGLCCERRAAISTSKNRQEAVMKAAQTYIDMVEKASNSGSPTEITKLLADKAKLFKTATTPAEAEKNLANDWKRWPKQSLRLFRCVADAAGQDGNFECDAVGTRLPADTSVPELSVFHVRFEFVKYKYTVFADPTSISRNWGPY